MSRVAVPASVVFLAAARGHISPPIRLARLG